MTDAAAAAEPLNGDTARELLERARTARRRAYAPYSGHPVGAALLCEDGSVFVGVNVENASYGLTTCAERTAVVSAVAAGARDFVAIAVAGPDDGLPCPPCGSCRQILHEAGADMLVITSGDGGGVAVRPLTELLPDAFGPGVLRPREQAP